MEKSVNDVLKCVFDLTDAEVQQNLTRNEVGKWDSLTHMDLVTSLEREFKITLTIDEIIAFESLDCVRSIMQEKGVSA